MKYTQGKYPVISKKAIAEEMYDLTLLCPEIAAVTSAGQFVNVALDGFSLRRPISICGTDKEKGTIRLVFQVRGEGTKALAQIGEGSFVDIIAPLGHGFTLNGYKNAVFVGGGIGTPPMLAAAAEFDGKCRAIIGFRNSKAVILEKDFEKIGAELVLCTDDGSAGRKGFVTAALADEIQKDKPDVIYACGPAVMLKGVAQFAKDNGIYCEVSMEERMGCGIGACLVCACRTVKNGEEFFKHVCKDGPVFNSEEVEF